MIAAGIPAAAYGFSREVAEQLEALLPRDERADVGGIGGTVAANVLSLAAMRATLGEVLTDDAFARMITHGERFEAGVEVTPELLRERGLVQSDVRVKVLARGEIGKALTVRAHKFSGKAAEKIAAAGGTAEVLGS